ncbi:hypothetical protein PMAYCL1PPCAC_29465 [Pristionchus mayeri]|uniref:Oxidation resistance protein 1 n=1 Tax=Pristionchus mayeri TaxID=1317129 RepID=A0AAN5DAX4_9BILA|nr:hypothetical protein PMAYCL1PPCAC_29465 [Pristionchus mayeri]
MLTDRLTGLRKLGKIRDQIRQKAMSLTEPPPMAPRLQMEYVIQPGDTLERIAASHDCTVGEVIKLNKMVTRMVFQGQKILVPVPLSDDVFDTGSSSSGGAATSTPRSDGLLPNLFTSSSLSNTLNNGITRGPGGAVPRRGSLAKTQSAPVPPRAETMEDTDTDCLQRFIKMKVKQVTESDGTVSGTLLVTPNCLMFDPDVTHPLVKENGSDLYGMVANMEEIQSVSVYKDIGGLFGDRGEKKKDIFDPEHLRTEQEKRRAEEEKKGLENKENCDEVETESGGVLFGIPSEEEEEEMEGLSPLPHSSLSGSCELPSITEGEEGITRTEDEGRKRTTSENVHREGSHSSASSTSPESRSRLSSDVNGEDERGKNPFQSARARSVGGTVASGARTVASATVDGTKTVAHGVVTHTKSAADAVEKGVTTTAKVVANGTKAAAGAVVSMPGNIVSMGSSFVNDGMAGVNQMCDSMFAVEEERSPIRLKREQSLATLEGLRMKTQAAREDAALKAKDGTLFSCATSSDEMPDLFMPVDQMIKSSSSSGDHTSDGQPILPFYMAVRLTRKKRKVTKASATRSQSANSSYDDDNNPFGNKLKREFWFAIPASQADNIYHFLLQWSPDKYGQDTTLSTLDESSLNSSSAVPIPSKDDRGFIVLDSEADESLTGDKPAPLFGNSLLNREWEIVTVQEMCRRLSLDHLDVQDMPIPEGANSSVILDELMIRQIMEILPARAEGYPWVSIYNSDKHGFSLATLYRKMAEFDEDMSPVLLIIRDTKDHVFGCVVSSAIRPSDHFLGTGDSSLLFRFTGEVPHTRELRHYSWTGENQFFVHAQKDCLSIGAGHGHNGLWVDADLNHGRSQRCDTFDNEPLAGENEDFIVQFVEAFGFRI